MPRKEKGVVYSTDHGRVCPECGEPVGDCRCGSKAESTTGPGTRTGKVRVERSTKGRKGRTVSVISGLQLNAFELVALARELKQRCGTGGTAKNEVIEIQGDHVQELVMELRERGFDVG